MDVCGCYGNVCENTSSKLDVLQREMEGAEKAMERIRGELVLRYHGGYGSGEVIFKF